jgi:DNA-binding response OmpR family regulator
MNHARILIVEDEAITAVALRHELINLGYEVEAIADSTQAAVHLAEVLRPDLVLMDITLPGEFDGITAALAIRGSVGAPVVFLTAHSDRATVDRAMLAGPFGYLVKPFAPAELRAAIELALRRSESEQDLRAHLVR